MAEFSFPVNPLSSSASWLRTCRGAVRPHGEAESAVGVVGRVGNSQGELSKRVWEAQGAFHGRGAFHRPGSHPSFFSGRFRRDGPFITILWALCSTRSRIASATVGSPSWSCHRFVGSWLVMIVDRTA
jgi:hypothetical protein